MFPLLSHYGSNIACQCSRWQVCMFVSTRPPFAMQKSDNFDHALIDTPSAAQRNPNCPSLSSLQRSHKYTVRLQVALTHRKEHGYSSKLGHRQASCLRQPSLSQDKLAPPLACSRIPVDFAATRPIRPSLACCSRNPATQWSNQRRLDPQRTWRGRKLGILPRSRRRRHRSLGRKHRLYGRLSQCRWRTLQVCTQDNCS